MTDKLGLGPIKDQGQVHQIPSSYSATAVSAMSTSPKEPYSLPYLQMKVHESPVHHHHH
jgi:hypothetical protein